jgi:uncharacterized protein YhaN
VAQLDQLSNALASALAADQERRRLTELKAEFESERQRLERQLEKKQTSRRHLLEQAGAREDEDFLRLAELHEQFKQAKQAADEEQLRLQTLAGSGGQWQRLQRELEQSMPLQLSEERDRLAAERSELHSQISTDEQASGGVEEQMRRLADDDRLGQRRLRQEAVKEELSDAVRQWAVRVVCRALLDRARQVYENERQPRVIQQASAFLGAMTSGRYRLVASLEETGVQLEDHGFRRKDESAWSSGLADQAYLAIRLGLAREFACHEEPLPMILDDVLIRFDPQRRRAAAGVLLDFARTQQVLLFSCRQDTAALVAQVHQEADRSDVPVTFYEVQDGSLKPHGMDNGNA